MSTKCFQNSSSRSWRLKFFFFFPERLKLFLSIVSYRLTVEIPDVILRKLCHRVAMMLMVYLDIHVEEKHNKSKGLMQSKWNDMWGYHARKSLEQRPKRRLHKKWEKKNNFAQIMLRKNFLPLEGSCGIQFCAGTLSWWQHWLEADRFRVQIVNRTHHHIRTNPVCPVFPGKKGGRRKKKTMVSFPMLITKLNFFSL